MTRAERLGSVDLLKTTGIVLVVVIHAVAVPGNAAEAYFLHLSRFAVPLFLAVSGWLQARTGPTPRGRTWQRLRRLLIPYTVASTLAELYWAWRGEPRSLLQIGRDYLLGASFGPYYFVFLMVAMIALAPLFARLSAATLLRTWIAIVALRAGMAVCATFYAAALPGLFWALREPTLGAQYFLAGWVCSVHREALGRFCRERFFALLLLGVATGGVLSFVAPLDEPKVIANLAGWLNTFVMSAVAALAASRVARVPPVVRFVGSSTYTIYLYHYVLVLEVERAIPPSTVSELAAWAAGMLGPCLLILGARRAFGDRARLWLGA